MRVNQHIFPVLYYCTLFSLCILPQPVWGEACFVDGFEIELSTQQDVDTFQSVYGGDEICDTVPGGLVIEDSSITNLNGLSDLTSILGKTFIENNEVLNDISGLRKLTSVGSFIIRNNPVLTNLDGLESLLTVGSGSLLELGLKIENNSALKNIDGIYALESVRELHISWNDSLISINGFASLDSVWSLVIDGNASLESINGFPALSLAENLHVSGNPSLISIGGFASLAETSLTVRYNDSLKTIGEFASLVKASSLFINNNNSLITLDGFRSLTNVERKLEIERNISLANVNGLVSLANVSSDFEIKNNISLTDIDGLSSLTGIGGDFDIRDNTALTNIDGLQNLTRVDGTLYLARNDALRHIDALMALTGVGWDLNVWSNDTLTNLNGFSSLVSVGNNVSIADNKILDNCRNLTKLLDDIDDGDIGPGPGEDGIPDVAGEITIQDNLPGCNSIDEIVQSAGNEVTTTFSVAKEFSDGNPAEVDIELTCDGVQSVTPIKTTASQASSAEFQVVWLDNETPECTASESDGPYGYYVRETYCRGIGLIEGESPKCTIYNNQRYGLVRVKKDFLNDDPMAVSIELTCDSGTVTARRSMASIASHAEFEVGDFHYDGTTCTATELVPDGYVQESSTCSSFKVDRGSYPICQITNKPESPEEPDPTAMTTSWFNPATSGEGFMIHSVNEELAVGYFYGYDNKGERLWLIGMSEEPIDWGVPVLFEAQYVVGGSFTNFDAESVIRSDWGTFEFTQWDCDSATIEMNGDHGTKTLQVVRLAPTSGSECSGAEIAEPTDAVTGSWYEHVTSGQGFSIHKIASDRGVVYFYGYNDTGENLWLIGVWEDELLFGQEVIFEMQQASGGTFDFVDPESIVRETWGTLTLRFDNCDSGLARLEGLDGTQELELVLLAGSLGLDCETAEDSQN